MVIVNIPVTLRCEAVLGDYEGFTRDYCSALVSATTHSLVANTPQ